MIAPDKAVQRPADARLLVLDAEGRVSHASRARWLDYVQRGDLVVANDAATVPASLPGMHGRTRQAIEVRLAAWRADHETPSLAVDAIEETRSLAFDAVVFGAGDHRLRTEDRPPPPPLRAGDRLALGSLTAIVERLLGHPRLVRLRFDAPPNAFWRGLALSGRPIQYAHLREALALWDTWTPIAGPPLAFEPPSAGFALTWQVLSTMRSRGIRFATLTHAAGLSSTGDAELDRRLPFDEAYRIPQSTARAIACARTGRARIIAIGTTVVRALEHAARERGGIRAGAAVATLRIDRHTVLRVVDALLTGTHEPGSSHHELLRAFASDATLARATVALERGGYRTHEFGDSMLVMRDARRRANDARRPNREAALA